MFLSDGGALVTYIQVTDLITDLEPLDGLARGAAQLGEDHLLGCIVEAEAEIEAALRHRYRIPFAVPAPALIRVLDLTISGWYATLRAAGVGTGPIDPNDPARLRYDRALSILARIADGDLDLPPDVTVVDPGTADSDDGSGDIAGGFPDLCVQHEALLVTGGFGQSGRWPDGR